MQALEKNKPVRVALAAVTSQTMSRISRLVKSYGVISLAGRKPMSLSWYDGGNLKRTAEREKRAPK